MQGVRGDDGGGIPGESPHDSTQEGGGDRTELENPGRRGRATEIPNGIPSKGRPVELPGGGMPGPSGYKDGNAGALNSPECTQHHGYSRVEKPPPPTVHPMRNAGTPAVPGLQAPCHIPVCQGSGVEETAACEGGDEVELREGP